MYFYMLLILFILYQDLMVQVITGKWCTHVLATLPLTCSRLLVPMVGSTHRTLWGHCYVSTAATTSSTTREHRAAASHAK
jgi:hypothetical protein